MKTWSSPLSPQQPSEQPRLEAPPPPPLAGRRALLANLHPGQAVKVKVTHPGGGTSTVTVTLGQLPNS